MTPEEQSEYNERFVVIENNLQRLSANMVQLSEALKQLAESQTKTEKMIRGIGRYAMMIAHDHESRIFNLESVED
jgi:hypothetical protein